MKEKIVPNSSNNVNNNLNFTKEQALQEFEELKNLALSCCDKNGNPNLSVALKALENKAKIAGLYSNNSLEIKSVVQMNEIKIDGEQLKLDIGEEFFN